MEKMQNVGGMVREKIEKWSAECKDIRSDGTMATHISTTCE
jgi:hypothetical protein